VLALLLGVYGEIDRWWRYWWWRLGWFLMLACIALLPAYQHLRDAPYQASIAVHTTRPAPSTDRWGHVRTAVPPRCSSETGGDRVTPHLLQGG
jgi:hypothetical protein